MSLQASMAAGEHRLPPAVVGESWSYHRSGVGHIRPSAALLLSMRSHLQLCHAAGALSVTLPRASPRYYAAELGSSTIILPPLAMWTGEDVSTR